MTKLFKLTYYLTLIVALTQTHSAAAARGDLLILSKLGVNSAEELESLGNDPNIIPETLAGLEVTHPKPKNGVTYFKVTYETKAINGESTVATGLLLVPDAGRPSYPLISFHHATETDRTDVPSTYPKKGGDNLDLAIEFGSQGYLVAAPDYIGLGDSPGFHPYFHKDTLISASVDMLRATKKALLKIGPQMNGQLFLTGYSEGGNTTMLLHRFLEKNLAEEFQVTAAAPMAGPYDLPGSLKEVMVNPSHVNPAISSAEIAYLIHANNYIYGGVFEKPSEVFQDKFAIHALEAFDGLHSPQEVLQIFSQEPLQVFQPTFVQDVLHNPNNRFIRLLSKNNAYGWTDWKPKAPITFYHGHADTEVPFRNSEVAMEWMKSMGLRANLVNLGESVDHGTGPLLALPLVLEWFESFRPMRIN